VCSSDLYTSYFEQDESDMFIDILQREPCVNQNRPWNPCPRLARRGCNTCSQCNKVAKQKEEKTIKTEIIRKRQAFFDLQMKSKKAKMVAAANEYFHKCFKAELEQAEKEAIKSKNFDDEIDIMVAKANLLFDFSTPTRRTAKPKRTSQENPSSEQAFRGSEFNSSDFRSQDSLLDSDNPLLEVTPLDPISSIMIPAKPRTPNQRRTASPAEVAKSMENIKIIEDFNVPPREESDSHNHLFP